MKTLKRKLLVKQKFIGGHIIEQNKLLLLILLLGLSVFACDPKEDSKSNVSAGSVQTDLADDEITEAINREYIVQDGIYADEVKVDTQDGIVTLSGSTDNILEKDRSQTIASMIKGVRAVINNIKVTPPDIDDAKMKENIENALLKDPATDLYEIIVEVNDGKVDLQGVVESWQEKQLAAKVAKGVRGVTELENNITFNFTTNRTDSEIENDIEQSMRWDVLVDDGLIDVTVEDANVKIVGTVGSAAEHSQAEVNAWISGVKSVDVSQLKVSKWARDGDLRKDKYVDKSDEEIKKAVKDAFLYDPRVFSFNPEVDVENGKVTLTGSVDNLKAKRAAEMIAENVVGVWDVENALKVEAKQKYVDAAIENDIAENLLWDPYVEKFEIDVVTDDGVVVLSGEVDNYFEKYRAEDLASTTNGVNAVINKIGVDEAATPYAYDFDYYHFYPFTRHNYDVPSSLTSVEQDREVENEIEEQFWWSPFLDLEEINVSVENGIATLTGTVDTWLEYDYAEQNAYDGGAFLVDNNLTVE